METAFLIIGGLGIFLFGIQLMTEGLKTMAGERLKELLSKFTGGVMRSIGSGALMTALLQSSSAMTFMTIGFVSAGLLTFTQSAGVIIGANLGSTSTGWIVSAIGFQINMTILSMPLIGAGVFLKLLTKDKLIGPSYAFIGFGLLFLGIDTLQAGMSGYAVGFDLSNFTGEGLLWTLILIMAGMIMTVLMQSSSAAVVTTITALHTGTIDFHEAALLVIGQNVGTTIKALIAAIGVSIPAKQTVTAHILFNLLTGLVAVMFLQLLIELVFLLSSWLRISDPAIQLALFHTVFNVTGVILILLIYPWFLKLVKFIIKDDASEISYSSYLDRSVTAVGPVATESAYRALHNMMKQTAEITADVILSGQLTQFNKKELQRIERGIANVEQFLSDLSGSEKPSSEAEYRRRVGMVHIIDHIQRLIKNLYVSNRHQNELQDPLLHELTTNVAENAKAISLVTAFEHESIVTDTEANAHYLAEKRKELRQVMFEKAAVEEERVEKGIDLIQGIQWIDRIQYHMWRAVHHLSVNK
ncbi:Na/Pi cotransporter family protein [Salisediminibacterium beveridgei]|uniref:Sodium-dependent phosphate transporter n=1 Tax=Salisediminibacterium beveridgei TaxID=632773 RepID=A0A1D7QVG3_9BACI|nr:Na/Pi symporter [Salisediminibacterium beveridgei]AOM82948.1 Sodium-dependent phosphate transporter [Salisediminibacterium beveridgei]